MGIVVTPNRFRSFNFLGFDFLVIIDQKLLSFLTRKPKSAIGVLWMQMLEKSRALFRYPMLDGKSIQSLLDLTGFCPFGQKGQIEHSTKCSLLFETLDIYRMFG